MKGRNDRVNALTADANVAIGWSSLFLGALSGLVLGLWSFGGPIPVPEWIGGYGEQPRRLLRLAHIAFFGLGILNIMMARQVPSTGLSARLRGIALWCMNFGNLALPVSLFIASIFEPMKYLLSAPALAITVALGMSAYGALQTARRSKS